MPTPVFGTANLFGQVDPVASRRLLRESVAAGFTAFDTAPSYGFGQSEPELGLLRLEQDEIAVSTKVGLRPRTRPSAAVRAAKAVGRRLPQSMQQRLRGEALPTVEGQFEVSEVRTSVEQSLTRLGRLERLLLHEVRPKDITDELLTYLADLVGRGDVRELGVATVNEQTAACVAAGGGLFRAVQLAVGPFDVRPALPPEVRTLVGHGALGPGGAQLRALDRRRRTDPELGAEWAAVTAGSEWGAPNGLAHAVLSRAAASGLSAVIIATSRPSTLVDSHVLLSGRHPLPAAIAEVLDRLIRSVGEAVAR